VTIIGTGFGEEAQVFFGSALAPAYIVDSPTEITARSPAQQSGQNVVDVTIGCNASVSPAVAADQFTYVAPSAPSPSPTTGP
jgi:hypothetical protein